jgi:hypothetical protein
VSGKEINDSPSIDPQRWIISFEERSQSEAEKYGLAFDHLRKYVLPERQTKDVSKYPRMVNEWWKFWHARQGLSSSIASQKLDYVLACARITKYIAVVRLPSRFVFSDKVIVFTLPGFDDFSMLQSSFHDCWAREHGSARGDTFNYVVKSCFDTLPRAIGDLRMAQVGREYSLLREEIMNATRHGITRLYNCFHDKGDQSIEVERLRSKQREMDEAVAAAYGWRDFDLGHGFHETKQGIRFTISEIARREVVDRLLALNHQRDAEEVAERLARPSRVPAKPGRKKKVEKRNFSDQISIEL